MRMLQPHRREDPADPAAGLALVLAAPTAHGAGLLCACSSPTDGRTQQTPRQGWLLSSPLPLPTGQGCCAHAPAPQTGGPGPPRGGAGSAILAGGGERDGQGCVRSPAPCRLGERLRPRPSLAWLTQAGRHPSRAVTGWCMFAAASSGNFPPRGGHVTCSHEKHRHRAAAPCPGSPAGSGGLAHVTVLPCLTACTVDCGLAKLATAMLQASSLQSIPYYVAPTGSVSPVEP